MARNITRDELIAHKDSALSTLNTYLLNMINNPDKRTNGKADKLSYWIEDWTKFLDFENRFSPSSLKRYKRGDIIKVHLGYNIGSEEGGLHYAVIIEKDNSIHNPVITIVPLTSIKPNKDLSCLKSGEVFLGNELFSKFASKFKDQFYSTKNEHIELGEKIEEFKANEHALLSDIQTLEHQQKEIGKQLAYLEKMKIEISKMKQGSIALVNQITTISKIRIYDPKTSKDIFSGIVLSNDGLDKIDKEIIKKFTK